MTSNLLPSSSSRGGGCTLTGALSVTTSVLDSVSIVHGPSGCAHHNLSLIISTNLTDGDLRVPRIISSGLREEDVIFGGENALRRVLEQAGRSSPAAIYVLTTCIAETIGDDSGAVCRSLPDLPAELIETAGFLGGDFGDGMNRALIALSRQADPSEIRANVNVIGEKNLEFGADAHFAELERLVASLDLTINLRFVRKIHAKDIGRLGEACINILRDDSVNPVGEHLRQRLGIPYIPAFPIGLAGTIRFLSSVADCTGIDPGPAIREEEKIQKHLLGMFRDIRGARVTLPETCDDPGTRECIDEMTRLFDLKTDPEGIRLPLPSPFPVGTSGIRRVLHLWRREIHG
jgi:nitrogenase molybdenum-iron protein alpha/beta subunit